MTRKKQLPALQWSGIPALLLGDWEAKHKAEAYSQPGEQCNSLGYKTPVYKTGFPQEVNEWMNWDKAHTSTNVQEENNATSTINANVCNSTMC